MKFRPWIFAHAFGLSLDILYVLCVLAFWAAPDRAEHLMSALLHMQLPPGSRALTGTNVIVGLIGWYLIPAAFGFLVASCYNWHLARQPDGGTPA